ncbi:MAG: methyltransferase domain-containing protein [Bacteroidales bacterium]|nr:methyltransferase domain-containing protein [Bacteroidales bacterium]
MNKLNCPWCNSEKTQTYIWVKDEFLTKEEFQIQECLNCGLLFTEPRPSKDKIGDYYKSEEYYSHQENKKGFIPKLYESIKAVNLKHKYKIATNSKSVGNLLDIGCGVGDFIHTAEEQGWQCTGVEPSQDAKAIAKKRIKAEILSSEDLEQIPNETFDIITMWHVLEHVDELKWQMTQLQRLIKKGGRIVIALPNYKSYDATFYKEKWAAYDVPRHLNHFNKDTLVKIFKTNDLNLVKTDKLKWDAYYISFMSEQYKHHTLPLIKGAIRGLISNCKARKTNEWSSRVYVFEKQ